MPLAQLQLQHSYRTGRGDMVKDFFVPCLEQSILYRRAAGYFTSHGLALAARGVASLVARGGQMRLVVSPQLDPEDAEALQAAIDHPADLLRSIASKSLADVEDSLLRDRLNALAWLAAAGFLQIRLAVRVDADGNISRGIFHEKTGIFTDPSGDHLAFTGSANETAGGLVENFESLEVFPSWQDRDGRVDAKIADFEALWSDFTPGLRTFDFSQAGNELLAAFRDPANPPPGLPPHLLNDVPGACEFRPPRGFELRDYQTDAIRAITPSFPPVPFRQVQLQRSEHTYRGDLGRDFFVPWLEQAVRYRRSNHTLFRHRRRLRRLALCQKHYWATDGGVIAPCPDHRWQLSTILAPISCPCIAAGYAKRSIGEKNSSISLENLRSTTKILLSIRLGLGWNAGARN